ncbi:MAG: Hsp20/alpha crystallin family protein [Chthoniobacteraceae bacterium]
MSLIRYINPELTNPSLGGLRDQFSRLFDIAFPTRAAESFGDWSPALDAHEDKDKYTVSLDVPGLKKDDIKVSVHDGVLTVSGERRGEKDVKEGTVHRTERYYGKFSRSVSLPVEVRADKVSATYKEGVLTVEIPKAEEAKPKTVEVKVS